MVMHHIYGFDAEGRPFMNMSLKLRLTKNWLEGPWRRIFHIPLDGSPLLHINNSTETEQMFMTPVLWYDEHGWGTYEFFCRPRQARQVHSAAEGKKTRKDKKTTFRRFWLLARKI